MIHHPVELAISFEAGTGVTRSVSREEVLFVTAVPLPVGRRLAGTLRSAPGPDGIATAVRYVARVTAVRVSGSAGLFEVEARLDGLEFAAPETA